ncbi:MAG TPA: prolipoprotein diacylglyceryl transferase family protein [Candidatus Dormibacteraeota bacterium]|nr:prolipoprotein diacylglyceryl transferase family protein [Candidatus Dormibacteraeota bacterium]
MLGVLTFTFDPVLQVTDTASVRWETIGLAIVLLIGLALAARLGSMTPAISPDVHAPGLRMDDLAFAIVGAVPGAVFGGRLGYVLDHLDFYAANPGAILDPSQGALTLTLAVPFGLLTGIAIARLLGAPAGRWMHAVTLPLLFVLAAGKAVGVLGATGQGSPSDLAWATAYLGPGPWASLAADLPSHPSQVYEAILVGLAVVGVALASRLEVVARRDGAALYVALGLWAAARFLVAFTWRDPAVVGPLSVEQLELIVVVIVAIVGFSERRRARLLVPGEPADAIEAPTDDLPSIDVGARLA